MLFFNAVSVPKRTSRCDCVRYFHGTKEPYGCYTLPKDFVLKPLVGQLCGRMLSLLMNHMSMWLPEKTAFYPLLHEELLFSLSSVDTYPY